MILRVAVKRKIARKNFTLELENVNKLMGNSSGLLSLMAARKGHFRLESGHHGELWLDLDGLFLQPARLEPYVAELAERLARYHPDALCGPMVGGAFLAQLLALRLDVGFYYTERVPASLSFSEGLYSAHYRLPPDLRSRVRSMEIVLVDDVINAGSALRATLAELRLCGARPVAAAALLVLGEVGAGFLAGRDLPLERIDWLPNRIWAPPDCPLCAAQIPLDELF